jgi:hypothetical protein
MRRITAQGNWYETDEAYYYNNDNGAHVIYKDNMKEVIKADNVPNTADIMWMTNGGIWPILGARIDKGKF